MLTGFCQVSPPSRERLASTPAPWTDGLLSRGSEETTQKVIVVEIAPARGYVRPVASLVNRSACYRAARNESSLSRFLTGSADSIRSPSRRRALEWRRHLSLWPA